MALDGEFLHRLLSGREPTFVEWVRSDGGSAGALVLRLNDGETLVTVGPYLAVVSQSGGVIPVALVYDTGKQRLLLPVNGAVDPDCFVDVVAIGMTSSPGDSFVGRDADEQAGRGFDSCLAAEAAFFWDLAGAGGVFHDASTRSRTRAWRAGPFSPPARARWSRPRRTGRRA